MRERSYLLLTWSEPPQIKCIHSCPYGRTSKSRRRKTLWLPYTRTFTIGESKCKNNEESVKYAINVIVYNYITCITTCIKPNFFFIFCFWCIAASGQMLPHWFILLQYWKGTFNSIVKFLVKIWKWVFPPCKSCNKN